jgi:hypothetical protein
LFDCCVNFVRLYSTFVWLLFDFCSTFVQTLFELCLTLIWPLFDYVHQLLFDCWSTFVLLFSDIERHPNLQWLV